jgi:hypothetical protein
MTSHSGFLTRSESFCGQPLPRLDRRQIDLGRGQSQGVAGGIQTIDQRPGGDRCADAAQRGGSQDQEIAPRLALMARHNLRLRQIGHWGTSSINCCPPDGERRERYTVEVAELCDRLPHKLAAATE